MVMVIIERFSKYAVFVAALIVCITEVAAGLFYQNVVKYLGVPFNIISDHDVRFIDRSLTTLLNIIGIRLKFSAANHSQTDRQTKRINALFEEYLRHYVTTMQWHWLGLLDSVQFCYNLQKSSTTEASPLSWFWWHNPKPLPRLLYENLVRKIQLCIG